MKCVGKLQPPEILCMIFPLFSGTFWASHQTVHVPHTSSSEENELYPSPNQHIWTNQNCTLHCGTEGSYLIQKQGKAPDHYWRGLTPHSWSLLENMCWQFLQGDAVTGPWNSECVFHQAAIFIGASHQCGVEIPLSENVSE